jgi:hypothetical protein
MGMRKFWNWFKTAPKVKSDKVLWLEKMNKRRLLLEAVDDERRNYRKNYKGIGRSKCGKITVVRVGLEYSFCRSEIE